MGVRTETSAPVSWQCHKVLGVAVIYTNTGYVFSHILVLMPLF